MFGLSVKSHFAEKLKAAEAAARERPRAFASYDNLLAAAAAGKLDRPVSNRSPDHAAQAMGRLLGLAAEKQARIEIVSEQLNAIVYDTLLQQLNACFKADCDIAVLLACDPANLGKSPSEFLRALRAHGVPMRFLAPRYRHILHFMRVGDYAYRLETDHDRCLAEVEFDDRLGIVSNRLAEVFRDAWAASAP